MMKIGFWIVCFVVVYLFMGILHVLFGVLHKYSFDDKAHSKMLFELLECAAPVFEKRGVRYAIMDGALLGSLRENEIIDGDDDIDMAVLYQHEDGSPDIYARENMRLACREIELKCDAFALSKEYNTWDYGQNFPIDTWRKIKRAEWRIFRKHPVLGISVPIFLDLNIFETDGEVFNAPEFDIEEEPYYPMDDYVPFRKNCNLYNVLFRCPNHPERILEIMYGKDWRIPRQDFKHIDMVREELDNGA